MEKGNVLEGLEPSEVFEYFENISSIPHGSGNTKDISDYLVSFANAHGLRYVQDELNNVVIFKAGSAGYEKSEPVIIQGHMDMVCEKEDGYQIDFIHDGLRLEIVDGKISARGTTLGGDDGIAVAMALAVLASDDIAHPPIEAVFTVDEEIGMLGASGLDMSVLSGKRMLNLDNEDEGYLLVSCAGGVTAAASIPVFKHRISGYEVTLTIEGLTGGHSGIEIDKRRANACRLMGRLLYELSYDYHFCIADINGGLKDNAIPRKCVAKLIFSEDSDLMALDKEIDELKSAYRWDYEDTDPELNIKNEFVLFPEEAECFDGETTTRIITALYTLPGGVQRMSPDIDGLVQTSLNLGILATLDNEVKMNFCVRSSVDAEKVELLTRMECLVSYLGGNIVLSGNYPGWKYRKISPLRDIMTQVFTEIYGQEPVIYAVHAGVECGIFADGIEGLDCISFGPELKNIHTPQETMDIASVQRTWLLLVKTLERLK